jgi:hypothetical protein
MGGVVMAEAGLFIGWASRSVQRALQQLVIVAVRAGVIEPDRDPAASVRTERFAPC